MESISLKISADKSCRSIVTRMLTRQLNKTTTYHPTLIREFSEEELDLIFGYQKKDIESYTQEIDNIVNFIESEKITSPKIIMDICIGLIPSHIAGLFDGRDCIEVSTDLAENELIIEIANERRYLTKEELVNIFRQYAEEENCK
jgi:hypothetical protein